MNSSLRMSGIWADLLNSCSWGREINLVTGEDAASGRLDLEAEEVGDYELN